MASDGGLYQAVVHWDRHCEFVGEEQVEAS